MIKPNQARSFNSPWPRANDQRNIELTELSSWMRQMASPSMLAAMKRGATAPDVRHHAIEARILQLLHRSADARPVVIELAGAVGQPYPHRAAVAEQPVQSGLSHQRCGKLSLIHI